VLDISAKWARHQQEQAEGSRPGSKSIPKLTVKEMQDMIARARGETK
jgi:hypothetical protein